MSSWYVWSALGLYPLYPGRAELVIGSPLFPAATIDRPGGRIDILGEGAAPDAPFVQTLTVNGRPSDRAWLPASRPEEHKSELQSLMRISYAVFCLKKKNTYAIIIQSSPHNKPTEFTVRIYR